MQTNEKMQKTLGGSLKLSGGRLYYFPDVWAALFVGFQSNVWRTKKQPGAIAKTKNAIANREMQLTRDPIN